MVSTIKFSEFVDGGDITQGDVTVGLGGGSNARFNNPWTFLPSGATGDRPPLDASMYYRLRFNTTLIVYEYYDPIAVDWVQIADSQNLPPPGAAGTFLQSDGADWSASTVTIPLTLAANKMLYTDSANSIAELPSSNGAILVTDASGNPSFLANPGTSNKLLYSNAGVSPAFTSYSVPVTGGSSGQFVATNGTDWVYTTATFPLVAGTADTVLQSDGTNWVASTPRYPNAAGSAGQIFRSNGANFTLSTATYPNLTTANQILYSSATNTIAGLASANNGILRTDGSGAPSIGNTVGADLTINSVHIGLGAGTSLTSTAVGFESLLQATTGDGNSSLGYWSLQLLTTGQRNTCGGWISGQVITTASDVTAFGAGACALNTASQTSAFGSTALRVNSSGVNNSAFGYASLNANTTGAQNSGFGNSSLLVCSTGADNSGFGRSALLALTTGQRNTAAGRSSLAAIISTNDSTGCGFGALGLATGGTNTALGSNTGGAVASGSTAITTGTGNTLLGYTASVNSAAAVGCIALGNAAVANAATGATSADDGPGIAIGSAGSRVGFRGDGTIYPTAGASAGYWLVKINGTEYKIQLYAKT